MADDREPPGDESQRGPHAFGPAPSRTPGSGVGFRSNLRLIRPLPTPSDAVEDEEPAPPEQPDEYRPRHARREDPDERPVVRVTPAEPAEPDEPEAEAEDAGEPAGPAPDEEPGPGRHRRKAGAIDGIVRSTRGRGLRGVQVLVLDDGWNVVASAVTGQHGHFGIEELPAGTYRVTADDEVDGDFGTAWHDGTTSQIGVLRVDPGGTRRDADIVLTSTARVDLAVDTAPDEAVVRITVTEQGTGLPAKGTVRVTTKRFSAELPLVRGRARLAVIGPMDGPSRRSRQVHVDYLGAAHTQPSSASARLR